MESFASTTFANFAVPTAIIIVAIVGFWRPPRWVARILERRIAAYEASQASTAKSVDQIRVVCARLEKTQMIIVEGMAKSQHETRRLADACERMADKIEGRRSLWSDVEREARRTELTMAAQRHEAKG